MASGRAAGFSAAELSSGLAVGAAFGFGAGVGFLGNGCDAGALASGFDSGALSFGAAGCATASWLAAGLAAGFAAGSWLAVASLFAAGAA